MSVRKLSARRIALACAALASFAATDLAWAESRAASSERLAEAAPESVGLSSQRLERLDEEMRRAVDGKLFPGIVTLAARHGKIVHSGVHGFADLASGKPLRQDAIFRIYSMTKPVTGVAMMILYEEGRWLPDDPIAKYIPEFANLKVFTGLDANGQPILEMPAHPPTMLELMTHTAGFTYGVFGNSWVDQQYDELVVMSRATMVHATRDLRQMIERLARIPLKYQPGTRWEYSISADIQAYIVEKLSSRPYAEFLRERIFEPLGMPDTAYHVPSEKLARVAALYEMDPATGKLVIRNQQESLISPPTMTPGGIGLYSTALDYLRFTQMLLNGGELDGIRILAPRSVELMRTNHLSDALLVGGFGGGPTRLTPDYGFGYDFGVLIDPLALGDPAGTGTYTWGGIAGTWFWIDPQFDVVFVGMTQRWAGPNYPNLGGISRATFYQALIDPTK
jgi:CubicO group peptidase (beta-lactamase class C family)